MDSSLHHSYLVRATLKITGLCIILTFECSQYRRYVALFKSLKALQTTQPEAELVVSGQKPKPIFSGIVRLKASDSNFRIAEFDSPSDDWTFL